MNLFYDLFMFILCFCIYVLFTICVCALMVFPLFFVFYLCIFNGFVHAGFVFVVLMFVAAWA